MKRRGFIGSLMGLLVAPRLPITLPIESSGIIYAPYIPITYSCVENMLTAQMIREIQEEIDREVIDKLLTSTKSMG